MERQHFSFGVRQVVINSVFSSLPIFMLSFFEILGAFYFKSRVLQINIFWQNNNHKKKYRLTSLTSVMSTQRTRGFRHYES